MKVSIIIPTKNEAKHIGGLLNSLKYQLEKKNFETIVVDNFSTDNTIEIAKKYQTKIYSAGPERSAQRNFGIKKAKGTYILFLDADMRIQKNVISECLQSMNKETGAIVIDEFTKGKAFLSQIKNLEKKIYANAPELEAARFFRKSDLKKIGGYDEKLIAGEDWDLTIRIKKFGKIKKIGSKIEHMEDHNLWEDIKKKYYYAQNIKKYAKKHPQEFKKQSGVYRITIIFQINLIIKYPLEFIGLLVLKTAHFVIYFIAQLKIKSYVQNL